MQFTRTAVYLLGAGIALAAGHACAANEIYRWVDEDGTVHFGNQPPTGVAAAVVGSSATEPRDASAATTPAQSDAERGGEEAGLSYAEQSRQAREERRRKHTEEQRKLEGECEIMRRQKEWVEPSPRVLVQGDDGNPRRLDDEERDELLREANAFLEEHCQ